MSDGTFSHVVAHMINMMLIAVSVVYFKLYWRSPAGARCLYNIALMSMTFIQLRINIDATSLRCIDVNAKLYKSHDVASTLMLCCINVFCPLGEEWLFLDVITLRYISAALMLFGWILCASVATVIGRYFQPFWWGEKMFGSKAWVQVLCSFLVRTKEINLCCVLTHSQTSGHLGNSCSF